MACVAGFGTGPWGGAPWGGAGPFAAVLAVALAENLVRVEFSRRVKWSSLLDDGDASDEQRYSVEEDASTFGRDERPARPVRVVLVRRPPPEDDDGTRVDVLLDRPLSPAPAEYVLVVDGVREEGGAPVGECEGRIRFLGLYRRVLPTTREMAVRGRDLASRATPDAGGPGGTLVIASGDYAPEERRAALRKRIFRRLLARKGAYAHLPPEWGVDATSYVKRLASPAARNALIEDAQRQISEEPEVERAVVKLLPRGDGTWRIVLLVRTRDGDAVKFDSAMDALVDLAD